LSEKHIVLSPKGQVRDAYCTEAKFYRFTTKRHVQTTPGLLPTADPEQFQRMTRGYTAPRKWHEPNLAKVRITILEPTPLIADYAISNVTWKQTLDPFNVSYDRFRQLGYDESQGLMDQVSSINSKILAKAWKEGVRQVVICKNEIVFSTTRLEDIPNELVMALAEKYDGACFVFSAPDLTEESAWSQDTPYGVDYPTIPLYIGPESNNDSEIENKNKFAEIAADFDTGTATTKAFPARMLLSPLNEYSPPLREVPHLDGTYKFFVKRAKVCSRSIEGKIHSTICGIRVVQEWDGCGLLQISPQRIGFVGRSIIGELNVKAQLDPIRKVTTLHE
jgi:hypothetical protein